jgi:hypothetical protein
MGHWGKEVSHLLLGGGCYCVAGFLVKVVKVIPPTLGIGGLRGVYRESWRKSLHNLHKVFFP